MKNIDQKSAEIAELESKISKLKPSEKGYTKGITALEAKIAKLKSANKVQKAKKSMFWRFLFTKKAGVAFSAVLLLAGIIYVQDEIRTDNLVIPIKNSVKNDQSSGVDVLSESAMIMDSSRSYQGGEVSKNIMSREVKVKKVEENRMYGAMENLSVKPMMINTHPGIPPYPIIDLPEVELPYFPAENNENYAEIDENKPTRVAENPVSTFSIDVDTGSYANVRRFLRDNQLPPKNAVRVEELVNYFNYDYASPLKKSVPFIAGIEIGKTPWNEKTQLLQVGIKGWENSEENQKDSNLVFLLDISGSMNNPDKLPLLKKSLILLSKSLKSKDKISVVTYAGNTATHLDGIDGNETLEIERVLNSLNAGGGTNGESGIQMAYNLAEKHFVKGGINRILLATDGDFNVGVTNFDSLLSLVEEKKSTGIALSTLGFGAGNYNDHLMEQLANHGDGNYTYIDSILEAKKALVQERNSVLETIAKDVKIQIEFNPNQIAEYRLIGYENRKLNREDFNNDQVDAGEIGAGHTVTALYEISLVGSGGESVDPLRYSSNEVIDDNLESLSDEYAFLKIRYKDPAASVSKKLEFKIDASNFRGNNSNNFKLASSVAAFAQKLKNISRTRNYDFSEIIKRAKEAKGDDEFGYRAEFIQLVEIAESLN